MLDPSKLIALMLAFFLGFASFGGVVLITLSTITISDIESNGIKVLPDEYFGDEPDVDISTLSLLGFYQEMQELAAMENVPTLGFLEDRYDVRLPDVLNNLISDHTREIPVTELFTEEGIAEILSTVYIGYIEGFECHKIDSNELGDPSDKENSRWYNPTTESYITGIDETIAYFTLKNFVKGEIETDAVLHDIVLADVLGYTYNEETDEWHDVNDNRVDGVMAVFADCTLDNVDEKINTVQIGNFLGYHTDDDGETWFEYAEDDTKKDVHPFMASIASSTLNSLGGIFEDMTIGDVIPEGDREGGVFAIIPADTELDKIGEAVNNSTKNSPMQFFMNQGIITFDQEQIDTLDTLCRAQGKVKSYNLSDEAAEKYYVGSDIWPKDADGVPADSCEIPEWRDQPLSNAFSYIVSLLLDINTDIEIPDINI